MNVINKYKVNSILNFIMFQVKYRTPNRRKSTIDQTYTDKKHKLKLSNVETIASKDSNFRKQYLHWQNHQHRRVNRINSMLKMRKEKLQEITEENQKIFIRINAQQSHYPSANKFETIDLTRDKENQEHDQMMGHLREFETPACFVIGNRGIMCEQRLGVDNIIRKKSNRKLPHLNSSKNQTIQKDFKSLQASTASKLRELLFYPTKQRRLPDIYMMI